MAFDPNNQNTSQNILDIAKNTSAGGSAAVPIGSQPMADSVSVTLASDQTPIPINQVLVTPDADPGNSSSVQLAGGATFTGTGIDVSNYVSVDISLYSDQASATNGLQFQFSQDGILWDFASGASYTIIATVGAFYSVSPRARYFRLIYTNGAITTTQFNVVTVLYSVTRSDFRANIDVAVPAGTNVIVGKTILAAQNIAGGLQPYTNLLSNASNILLVDDSMGGITQGSTTSGQGGQLVMGATTTSAPTYVTGDTYPLSLTTAGALRVDASSTTQPVYQSPPSKAPGRTYIQFVQTAMTTTNIMHVVTVGKTFYLEAFGITAIETGGSAPGGIKIEDDFIGGTIIPLIWNSSGQISHGSNLIEPLQFHYNVEFVVLTGTVSCSAWFVGYEQ